MNAKTTLTKDKRIIVVGAGISGLTSAYRLQKAGFSVTVLESTDHVGGRAHTVKKSGYTCDTGAGAIAESYYAYLDLAKELGLFDQIVQASPYIGVIRNRIIHYMNSGNIFWSGIFTGAFSWRAKFRLVRAFIDVRRATKQGQLDYTNLTRAAPLDFETTEQYCMRRLDVELSEYFSEPMIRGMTLVNSDRISKVDLLHGINNLFSVKMFGMRGGVSLFSEALARRLDVKLQHPVTSVRAVGSKAEVSWYQGERLVTEMVDGAVVACPLPAASKMCPEHSALQTLNNRIKFGQCISVVIGTRQRPHCKAYILNVPRRESEEICFMFLEHNKTNDAAPEGHGLILVYLEDLTSARLMDAGDEDIVARVMSFVEQIMPEVAGTVDMTHVTRWRPALQIAAVGAYQAVADFNAAQLADTNIQFACDYTLAAVGQSVAVESGNRASTRMIEHVSHE